jgi:hypothetical protein
MDAIGTNHQHHRFSVPAMPLAVFQPPLILGAFFDLNFSEKLGGFLISSLIARSPG